MQTPWKLATIGLALMGTTALGTGLTTAWMLRPTATATAQETPAAAPAAARMVSAGASYPLTPAVVRPTAPSRVARTAPPVTRVSTAAADCGTNGDRVMRIAKPGLLGGLLGAGLGAAGGAVANGGKAAGRGALIGGLAGTVLGAGYGAYKTKNECGTVFNRFNGNSPAPGDAASPASQAAFGADNGITVYNAR
jgi:hypothetical protein